MSILSPNFFGGISKTIYTRINTHKKSKLVDSYILNYESVFELVNKVFGLQWHFFKIENCMSIELNLDLGAKFSFRR